jgi:hypothetical protein
MLRFVTVFAECQAVTDFKSKFRKLGEWLYVMRVQFWAIIARASHALVTVAPKNCATPAATFRRPTGTDLFLRLTRAEEIMIFTARRSLARQLGDQRASFWRMLFSEAIGWFSFSGFAHFCTRFERVLHTFERAWSVNARLLRTARMKFAASFYSVVTRAIYGECIARTPVVALITPRECSELFTELFKCHAVTLRFNLQRAFACLCHS